MPRYRRTSLTNMGVIYASQFPIVRILIGLFILLLLAGM